MLTTRFWWLFQRGFKCIFLGDGRYRMITTVSDLNLAKLHEDEVPHAW